MRKPARAIAPDSVFHSSAHASDVASLRVHDPILRDAGLEIKSTLLFAIATTGAVRKNFHDENRDRCLLPGIADIRGLSDHEIRLNLRSLDAQHGARAID